MGLEFEGEQAGVAELASGARTQEPAQLRGQLPITPGRLFLQTAERTEVAFALDDGFDVRGTEGSDQFILEILDADEEAKTFSVGGGSANEELLGFVHDASHLDSLILKVLDVPSKGLRSPDGYDDRTFRLQISSQTLSQGLQCHEVTDSFDEDHHPSIPSAGQGDISSAARGPRPAGVSGEGAFGATAAFKTVHGELSMSPEETWEETSGLKSLNPRLDPKLMWRCAR